VTDQLHTTRRGGLSDGENLGELRRNGRDVVTGYRSHGLLPYAGDPPLAAPGLCASSSVPQLFCSSVPGMARVGGTTVCYPAGTAITFVSR
jgi:hypothetical protein